MDQPVAQARYSACKTTERPDAAGAAHRNGAGPMRRGPPTKLRSGPDAAGPSGDVMRSPSRETRAGPGGGLARSFSGEAQEPVSDCRFRVMAPSAGGLTAI